MAKLLGLGIDESTVNILVLGAGAIVAVPLLAAAYQTTRGVNAIAATVDRAAGATVDTRETPFEGTGVVGVLGNTANSVTGGLLGRFGSFLGRKAADVADAIKGTGDPNAIVDGLAPIEVTARRRFEE